MTYKRSISYGLTTKWMVVLFRDGKDWRKICFGKRGDEFNAGNILILRCLGDIVQGGLTVCWSETLSGRWYF